MSGKKKMKSMDGNQAASYVAYAFTEVAAIYPITPSSAMAEHVDEWSAHGMKNIFGDVINVVEMQSEAGAAGAVHGALQSGALTTTFTASQGLLLMIPNMYKISGELLPGVFHVSARSLSTHALSIFGDHSDVYSTRQTGFAMLASSSVQEVMDLGSIAHLTAIKSRVPFLHFFDGFRTSHEVQKIEVVDYDDLEKLLDMDAVDEFRERALNPESPVTRGTAQNPDIFFQEREASNLYYDNVPDLVAGYMDDISKITGRKYRPFVYYGAKDAENIVIAMGSVTETLQEVVDYLNSNGGKVGLVTVHLYRPFSTKYLVEAIPDTVKAISVLDRTKEPGAEGEPLYLDIRNSFYGKQNQPLILGGRYGLSSKDVTPGSLIPVFENMKLPEPKNGFTVGIVDDITFKSLPLHDEVITVPDGTIEAKFYGIGSDGTVGANKNSIKIIGDHTDLYSQAYFSYDSKKSGGVTVSHLRFGKSPIKSTYLITNPDFVACHVPSYLDKYDMLKGLKRGGTFLINSMWDADEVKNRLTDQMKKYIAENDIKVYILNATNIAEEIGLGTRTNTIMQSAFFKLAKVIPYEESQKYMKDAIQESYGTKGDNIVNMNNAAVDKGGGEVEQLDIPSDWKDIVVKDSTGSEDIPAFIRDVVNPINSLKGDQLPVSSFKDFPDGTFPPGTAAYEKRGIAVHVPMWISENCIQCNQCAFVCPHAVIRPFLLNDKEAAGAPEGTVLIDGKGKGIEGHKFRIQISPLDCTGCGNCQDVCPAKEKALVMQPIESQMGEAPRWEYFTKKVSYKGDLMPQSNIKGSQFLQPLFEYSGACAGCGETPYVKLITQLFGNRMMIANATGCSSIYGGSAPSTPYCTNSDGCGPAWASSLFEDAAEFGYGMLLGINQMKSRIMVQAEEYNKSGPSVDLKSALGEWIENNEDADRSIEITKKLVPLLEKDSSKQAKEILKLKSYLIKKSVWSLGGDGWAYDIGYGGLDHVLASGDDINVMVLDTEVYSNTGGQSSKATPTGSVAKFAASGKRVKKKDLGMMAMSYGYVYVAQIAMGSSQIQTLKAIREAEAYPGPSLVIAYSPCINHGLRAGMGKTQQEEKNAVESGYWHLYRFNPLLEKEGKNPFTLDSKEPQWDKFQDFLMSEIRYTSLKQTFPDVADELYREAEEDAKWRYKRYRVLSEMDYSK